MELNKCCGVAPEYHRGIQNPGIDALEFRIQCPECLKNVESAITGTMPDSLIMSKQEKDLIDDLCKSWNEANSKPDIKDVLKKIVEHIDSDKFKEARELEELIDNM